MVLDQSFLCLPLQPKDWGAEHCKSGHNKCLQPSAPFGGLESTHRTHLNSGAGPWFFWKQVTYWMEP